MKLVFLVLCSSLWLSSAINGVQAMNSEEPKRSTYIVHMDKSHMPEPFLTHHGWYSSLVDSVKHHHHPSSPSILYSYDAVLHGFSATLLPQELDRLKNCPGFVSARREKTAEPDTTRSPEFLSLSPSAGAWPASNFGENAIIGVIDSGIWPESESFNDDGMTADIPSKWKGKCEEGQDFNSSMCNRKLIGARFFNKGLIAANGPDFVFRMNSARDSSGHGTHTAATAAGASVRGASYFGYATGTAMGTAPRTRLAAYKVSWPEGSRESDVIAGIDRAVEDGVDVLSISLSFLRVPLYDEPLGIATFAAIERGVFVALSAGNRGPETDTLRNASPWAATVAAGTMDRSFGGTVRLGDGATIRGFSMFPAGAIVENVTLLYNETLSACNSSSLLSQIRSEHGNRIIICDASLIEDSESSVTASQLARVTESQVIGAILISNEPRILESAEFTCPCVVISPEDGQALIEYARRSNEVDPFATLKFQQTFLGTKPAPAAASYSSRGPALGHRFIIKPDIMAPGTRILAAAVPTAEAAQIGTNVRISNDFSVMSGTSMSCPHIAGVAALIKSAHPDWSPTAIKSAMMTTANPLDNTNSPIIDNGDGFRPATPLAMGSGHVDPNRSLDPGLVYDAGPQDYVDFLCALDYTEEEILTITRTRSYNCSNPSSDLNYPSFFVLCDNSNTTKVHSFRRVATNVGDGPAAYNVTVRAPTGLSVRVSPEALVFEKKYEKRRYTVSFRCGRVERYSFGELVWVERNGKRRVRSPILVTFDA